jgi:hypothetical protein
LIDNKVTGATLGKSTIDRINDWVNGLESGCDADGQISLNDFLEFMITVLMEEGDFKVRRKAPHTARLDAPPHNARLDLHACTHITHILTHILQPYSPPIFSLPPRCLSCARTKNINTPIPTHAKNNKPVSKKANQQKGTENQHTLHVTHPIKTLSTL